MADLSTLNTPEKVAQAAEEIYAKRFKDDLEAKHLGEFVVVDVVGEQAYSHEFAEQALERARQEAPGGVFHLMRIGSPAAFRSGSVSGHHDSRWHWTLRPAG